MQYLLDDADIGGAAKMFRVRVAVGARVPAPHSHDLFDETTYGLSGAMTRTVDGEERIVGPGDGLCIRRGQVHGFEDRGTEDAHFLCVATPGVFRATYFMEMAEVLQAATSGPPNMAAIATVMRRHGLTPAGRLGPRFSGGAVRRNPTASASVGYSEGSLPRSQRRLPWITRLR